MRNARRAICVIAILSAVSACVHTGNDGATGEQTSSELDVAIARCIATTVIGGIVGGVIGHYIGGNNGVAAGAAIGAGAGAASCAILTAINEKDKEQIRKAQLAAAESGTPQIYSYQGDDGRFRQLSAVTSAVPLDTLPPMPDADNQAQDGAESTLAPKAAASRPATATQSSSQRPPSERICRYVDATLQISGQGTANLPREIVCRTSNGDWRTEPAKSA